MGKIDHNKQQKRDSLLESAFLSLLIMGSAKPLSLTSSVMPVWQKEPSTCILKINMISEII